MLTRTSRWNNKNNYYRNFYTQEKNKLEKRIQLEGLNTTTKGNLSEGMPPGGKEKSLLRKLYDLSEDPPFGRCSLELLELLELATEPFPTAFEGSIFMSEIFFTFFSWTCSNLR